jgi:hypothetical protein
MNVSVETNIPQFDHAVVEFIKFYGVSIAKALRYQGRLLAQEVIKKTPPNTRAQGRHAVERDIKHAVRPLRPQDFRSKKIQTLIRKRDYSGLAAVFSRFPTNSDLRGVAVVPFDPKLHAEARDNRGRVKKFQRKATPDYEQVAEYIKHMQQHVGQAKGGWAASLIDLGGRPAAWIAEHADAGQFEDHSNDLLKRYIQMTNASEWAGGGDEDRVIANSLRSRSLAILTSLAKAQDDALRGFNRKPKFN